METLFYTLQGFYTHTEGVTYLLIIVSLVCIACFWNFLAGKDEDNNGKEL